jgi:hypothetical protein
MSRLSRRRNPLVRLRAASHPETVVRRSTRAVAARIQCREAGKERMASRKMTRIATEAAEDIDRMVANVRRGRFERSLAALTAAGAMVTAAEIFFEHDKASFGNTWMWAPVALGPIGAAAGVAGVCSKRAAKTLLPLASATIVANGLQGLWLHARGIKQKPGGWKNFRYNMEMGPPLMAPLLVTLVGGMGLLAAVLRRER